MKVKVKLTVKNIVAVITLNSSNIKLVIWLDFKCWWIAIEASKSGSDESVCGQCVHRHFLNGSCYVTLFRTITSL
jgi:hypothetical protein